MSFMHINAKKTSAAFDKYFDPVKRELGFWHFGESYSISGGQRYVRTYTNKFVQIEMAGDQNFFHAEIRRLVNGEPRPYSDSKNNIGFEDLAVLLTNNNYNHFDYYPASVGWDKVVENTIKLFVDSKEVFITDKWVDTDKIERLKDEAFFKKFGKYPNKQPGFFELVRQHVLQFIREGWRVVLDSVELPPYADESYTQKIILEKGTVQVKFAQLDWRDAYSVYYIEVNEEKKLQADLAKNSNRDDLIALFKAVLDRELV